jgi:hypothetical protein
MLRAMMRMIRSHRLPDALNHARRQPDFMGIGLSTPDRCHTLGIVDPDAKGEEQPRSWQRHDLALSDCWQELQPAPVSD